MIVRVIIVDDNEDALNIMEFFTTKYPNMQVVDKCRNGKELIESVIRHQPNLVLLDINMPELSGIEAMRKCLKIKQDLLFIFITSFDEYAVEAFELSAVDYIVKPIEKTRFYVALEKAKRLFIQQKESLMSQRLILKEGQAIFYVPIKDIIFIEKTGKKCSIITINHEYITNDTIEKLSSVLPNHLFFLSHRSFIINLTMLSSIVAKSQTYLAYFNNSTKYAHVSKLKLNELQNKLNILNISL
ncbi:LytR/AlgR family response regulator transcription factor [Paenibacillus physcomitrellae]|uniref:DNA-binding response regulator n=1 Tax=Paenibacillus physcomitrellae TaxID=1619311 RepID=A0ABQ1FS99_9BACL|nr:LytTR family DNA-binding domain-containing protein [Paenibacillus physcomitrellae]GGA26170.1 DNA-binding response regulator [Paenibacillus physcomitrellae]